MKSLSNSRSFVDERNFYAPGGKLAALFLDIDGTIMVCQPYFDEAFEEFATFMKFLGINKDEARDTLRTVYNGSMPHRGFERERFPEALIETYELLLAKHNILVADEDVEHIRSILKGVGSAAVFRKPKVFADAQQVLTRAHDRFLLIAVTIGDYEVQQYKIRQGGLDKLFDGRIITLQEGKDDLVQEAIEDYNVDPHHSAFVGNSIRSDGVCLKKTNFVYLPLESSLPKAGDKLPENTGFLTFNASNWREVEQRAINRLLRRRDIALMQEDQRNKHR